MVVSITLPSKLSNANRCNGNIKKIFILQIFQQCSLFQCIDPSWYLSVDMQLLIQIKEYRKVPLLALFSSNGIVSGLLMRYLVTNIPSKHMLDLVHIL